MTSLGFASPGAVRQHGNNLPIRECARCGDQIVWVTSSRTGRRYPANVRTGYLDQRFYIGSDLHPRDCADRKAILAAEFAAFEDNGARARALTNELNEVGRAAKAAALAATTDAERAAIRDAHLAATDAIFERYEVSA
jgi:hypothetical protein